MPERKWFILPTVVTNITSQGLACSFVITHKIGVLKDGEESPLGEILDVAVRALIRKNCKLQAEHIT